MNQSCFETFVRALGKLNDPQGVLGREDVIFPPSPDYGYGECGPKNALTFGAMGIDGVHYVVLTRDGKATDDMPVIEVDPWGPEYRVLAETFLDFLANGCGVSAQEMAMVIANERNGQSSLANFLRETFDIENVTAMDPPPIPQKYLAMMEPRTK